MNPRSHEPHASKNYTENRKSSNADKTGVPSRADSCSNGTPVLSYCHIEQQIQTDQRLLYLQ